MSSKLQSYKDKTRAENLCWDDIHFQFISNLSKAKMIGDQELFIRAIYNLDLALVGFRDATYDKDMEVLLGKKKQLENENAFRKAEAFYYDELGMVLSKLLFRINKGELKKKEYVYSSEIVKEIAYKLKTGFGQNALITGKTGSGKSYTAIKLALQVTAINGVKFDIKNHVTFSPLEFTKVYNNAKLTPPGSVIIYDEAGVTFSSRDSSTKGNKNFQKLMQIIRHRQIFVIFTCPDMSYMDLAGRKLLHWWFETKRLDKTHKVCYLKPHLVEVMQATGDIYYPFPRFDDCAVNELRVTEIDKNIGLQYEKKAAKYKKEMAEEAQYNLAVIDTKVKRDPLFDQYKKHREDGTLPSKLREIMKIGGSKQTRYERLYQNILAMSVQADK